MNKKNIKILLALVIFALFIVVLIIKFVEHHPHVEFVEAEPDRLNQTQSLQQPPPIQVSSKDSTPAKVTNLPKVEVGSKPAEAQKLSPEDLEKIKQMRSNAKANLAGVYTALKSFQAEWDRYSTDLNAIGFAPYGDLLPFKLGFISQYHPPIDGDIKTGEHDNTTEYLTTDQFNNKISSDSKEPIHYNEFANKIKLSDYSNYCQKGCTASDNEFEVLLVLPLLDPQQVDVWTVNDRKEIIQVVDGLADK